MPVAIPPCAWPRALDERGPPEDPTILLTATATIGEAAVQVIAIRMRRDLRWTPDYLPDIPAERYDANELSPVLEAILESSESLASDIADILGENSATTLDLPTGQYRIWLLPERYAGTA